MVSTPNCGQAMGSLFNDHYRSSYVIFLLEKILESLAKAILAVSDNPEKTQQTAAVGTLF
jgi:hypothetical protein